MASSNTHVKIENLCRTCLSKEFKMLPIFDIRLGMESLNNIITSITGVKIEQGDGLPSTICNDCKEKVLNAYDFRTRSQEAEITLRRLLPKENVQQSNENNLVFKANSVEIKTEQYVRDNHDDYMDLDLSLALSNVEETFNNVDAVKCEDEIKGKDSITNTQLESTTLKDEVQQQFSNSEENEHDDNTYCPLCGSGFSDAEGLTKHAWEQHADFMGPKKRGRPKKLLTSTIIKKLSEKGYNVKYLTNVKYNCIFCKENVKTKQDLLSHTLQHKDVTVYSCLMCERMYLKKNHLEQHQCLPIQNDHTKQGDPPDEQGTNREINAYKEALIQDVLLTNANTELECMDLCEECGEIFLSRADFSKHRDRDHPELSSRCHLCDKVFATVKSAARHRAMCARVERLFVCPSCGLRFAYEVSLNKHILRAHAGQSVSVRFMDRDRTPPQYRCDICSRRFYRKDTLARHAKIHKQIEKCFECDVCKKKFQRRDNLKSHMRVHNGSGPSASTCLCLYCGRSFSNSSNLIVHMRRHTGEKPYKCDFCDKGFPRSSDLQCHRRSHTGEKPCICGVCGKAFSRSNKLSRHMRVHTGAKPYKCSYCEKAFSQSNDLTLHVRRHTGDKPYVCEVCGDRFIQGTALHNHRRAHGHYPPSETTIPLVYTVQTIAQTH